MAKASHILGLNARQQIYKAFNSPKVFEIANSKLLTKKYLAEKEVAHPQLFQVFSDFNQVKAFDFTQIKSSFVIKPSGGSAGKGILIIRKYLENEGKWLDINGSHLTRADLELHINDILDGQYSTFGKIHEAFVEERIAPHKKFKKYVYSGTPDIRIIVFNNVPVMAMLRLPTKESEGRANLHQGAIGVGIDISSGVTLKGVKGDKLIGYLPGTKRKLNGIQIPFWNTCLKVAVEAADAIGMMFGGIDLLLANETGPKVVELNASPGLSIQIANRAGLKRRLERVQGLKINNVEHGVRVGKALFAESFADKVKGQEGLQLIGSSEMVKVVGPDKKTLTVPAIIDSGRYRSQISKALVEKLNIDISSSILWEKKVGLSKQRVIELVFYIKSRKIKTGVSVVSKLESNADIRIGRKDLEGFLVDVTQKNI